MTLSEVYSQNPTLLGSPKMIAIYECLAGIPSDERKVQPTISPISITSDGFVVAGEHFLGSAKDLETNLKGLCETFGSDEFHTLMNNISDWR